MVALAITYIQQDVPAEGERTITLNTRTLSAALRLSYLAGQAEAAGTTALMEETFQTLRRMIRDLKRSLRRARPTPRQEIESGLDQILYVVEAHLGIESVLHEHNGQPYRVYAS